jgi:DNA-binding response OmpR family regulator
MFASHGYILVLDTEPQGHRDAYPLEAQLQYPVFIAKSVDQAVSRAMQTPPGLVILIGDNDRHWSASLVQQLRQNAQCNQLTIVALSDSTSPQWNYLEETPGVDGFLVKPLSTEILRTLVESAFARRNHE